MSSNYVPSKYTAVIHNLRQQGFDFGLNDYPIFDEEHRRVLNELLLNHYDFNEIGQETPFLFKLYLNRTMNEIMPYYNELFKSTIEFSINLLKNVNISENLDRLTKSKISSNSQSNSNSTNENSQTGTGESKSIFNQTPQGQILKNAIDEQNYATTLTQDKSISSSSQNAEIHDNTTNESSQNATGDESYQKSITGSNGNYLLTDIVEKFRKNILNIDYMIITDERIQELFFSLL